jgi:hypothetical protein
MKEPFGKVKLIKVIRGFLGRGSVSDEPENNSTLPISSDWAYNHTEENEEDIGRSKHILKGMMNALCDEDYEWDDFDTDEVDTEDIEELVSDALDLKADTTIATTITAGLLPKLDIDPSKYLRSDATWVAIAGGGDMTRVVYDPDLDGVIAVAQLDPSLATTGNITTHAGLTGTHGAGTIASVAAATALITTHASSTDAHIGGAGTVLSMAAGTVLITTHAGSTNAHGAATVLSMAAGTVLITTHAGSTDAHIGGAGTVLSVAAATVLITTHAGSTAAHIGGAGTVLSTAAATILIQTHNASTTAHGLVTIVAASVSVTGTALTDITGFSVACASATNYKFDVLISGSASHTTGVMYAFAYSGSNALVEAQMIGYGASTAVVTIAAMTTFATKSAAFNKTTGTAAVRIGGVLKVATTTGNFSIQHCAGSAAATSYIRALSVFEIRNVTTGGAK